MSSEYTTDSKNSATGREPDAPVTALSIHPQTPQAPDRRAFMRTAAAAVASIATLSVIVKDPSRMLAQGEAGGGVTEYGPDAAPVDYPNNDVIVLNPERFTAKIGNTPIRRLYTGMMWAEGPAWNGVGNYLIWSDIPANVQHRWLNEDGHVSVFRNPSGQSNGNTFDWEGRQISCEHLNQRVVRYEHDGSMTVLADSFEGEPFNSPNDVIVHPDGGVWFTDPPWGIVGNYEGIQSDFPQPVTGVYRIDPNSGAVTLVADDLNRPNGLCFSPDFSKLYVVTAGPGEAIVVFDVDNETSVSNGQVFTDTAYGDRMLGSDGIQADVDGNIWASAGWNGPGYNGVHIYAPDDAERIGQILLPETTSNLTFGGPRRNRLFITASQSVYAVYVNTQGAHIS
jgi:gluconolactonase